MLKNLFKQAKKLLKNPLVQLGIGAFLPQTAFIQKLAQTAPLLANPAVLQGGISLLAGDKPENVARNIGIQALLGGLRGMGEGGPGFVKGAKSTFKTPETTTANRNISQSGGSASVTGGGTVPTIGSAETYAKAAPETFLSGLLTPENLMTAAEFTLPFIAAAQAKDAQQQIDPRNLGINLDAYRAMIDESPYQSMAAAGGIQGFKKGGADPTNGMNKVSYGSTMGEPNGLFTGPGGPKEDKIDVMLSPGEFVVTAEATKKIGVDNLYDMMNKVDPDSESPEEYRERVGMA